MDWAIYGALIAAALAIAGAATLLVLRILQGWRTWKRARRHLARDLAALAASADRTSEIVERISDQRELEASLVRLRTAVARLNVLRAAVDEASHPLRTAAAFRPRA